LKAVGTSISFPKKGFTKIVGYSCQSYRDNLRHLFSLVRSGSLSPVSNVQIVHNPNVHGNGVICTYLSLKTNFVFIQDLEIVHKARGCVV
jgi:hypothetical protein